MNSKMPNLTDPPNYFTNEFKEGQLEEAFNQPKDMSVREHNELAEAKATMIVNFGTGGRAIAGLIDGSETLSNMIKAVFTYYHEREK